MVPFFLTVVSHLTVNQDGAPDFDDRNHDHTRLLSLAGYQGKSNLYKVRFWTTLTQACMRFSFPCYTTKYPQADQYNAFFNGETWQSKNGK